MKKIIKLSLGNEIKFKALVEQKIDHYCGKHEECANSEQCKKFKHIIGLDAKKAFVVIIFFKKINIELEYLVCFCRDLLLVQNGGHYQHCGGSSCCQEEICRQEDQLWSHLCLQSKFGDPCHFSRQLAGFSAG
jgi:hypothetical protein